MAGSSMAFTYDDGTDGNGLRGTVRKIICDWVSDDATGAVSGTTKKIVGTLVKGVTDPGTPAPTANYDIALTDEASADILTPCQSSLANRHTTNSETVHFLLLDAAPLAQSLHPVICDKITVAITNAGNSKAGQLVLYYRV